MQTTSTSVETASTTTRTNKAYRCTHSDSHQAGGPDTRRPRCLCLPGCRTRTQNRSFSPTWFRVQRTRVVEVGRSGLESRIGRGYIGVSQGRFMSTITEAGISTFFRLSDGSVCSVPSVTVEGQVATEPPSWRPGGWNLGQVYRRIADAENQRKGDELRLVQGCFSQDDFGMQSSHMLPYPIIHAIGGGQALGTSPEQTQRG